MTKDKYILVLTCVASEQEADTIASRLVEESLAACINIMPVIRSVYVWKGNVCREEERLLLVKTVSDLYEEVEQRIKELHSYELPEIISIDITGGYPEYLNWIKTETKNKN